MAVSNIESLVASYCESAGIAEPPITPDGGGLRSVTLHIHGVDVYVQQLDDHTRGCVYLAADLGEPPPHLALEAWRVLLRANMYMGGASQPLFSRNPVSGRAMVHWAYALNEAFAADFQQRVTTLADLGGRWRMNQFLDEPDHAHAWFWERFAPPAATEDEAKQARDRFDELRRSMSESLGQAASDSNGAEQSSRMVPVRTSAGDLALFQFSVTDAHHIHLAFATPSDAAVPPLAEAVAAMDMNFHLATEARATRIGFDDTDAVNVYVVAHTFPLTDATAEAVLTAARDIARGAPALRAAK